MSLALCKHFISTFLMTLIDSYCYVPFSEKETDAQLHSSRKWQNSDSKAHLFGFRHHSQPTFIKY